jgi:hypothetical protein
MLHPSPSSVIFFSSYRREDAVALEECVETWLLAGLR